MTRLFNDEAAFADELTEGFVAANGRFVRRVRGGVVRSTPHDAGMVALVIGGGSGHYPAFGGLVGPGLAHGAAMGNVFASPSAQAVESVALAAEQGAGVVLSYGNYAGDVLNFSAAQRALRERGVVCESVLVTDDIASAPPAEKDKRRGIAGDLVVFKVAGAAASDGYSLDEVVRVARHANDRTRSLGVAFSGCTLPGADHPLFTVPEGRMAVGLGIHGEPGISEVEMPTADGLSDLLVSRLLAEIPSGVLRARGARVVPVLNGLGSVKYEELFVVYSGIRRRLEDAGVELVDPQVGEFCTSFDMAGLSLSLVWLDDELERLWEARCETAAFRKSGQTVATEGARSHSGTDSHALAIPVASVESQAGAESVLRSLTAVVTVLYANADELGRIDAVAGDGDHGIGMQRGAVAALAAAEAAAEQGAGVGTVLAWAADAWSDRAGGTSGALWGIILSALGDALGDQEAPDAERIALGVRAGLEGIQHFGRAEVGDKTMVDALVPFAGALDAEIAAGRDLTAAWTAAARMASESAAATARLLPRIGRARSHASNSLGTPDAGAVSLGLIAAAVAEVLTERRN